MYADTIQHTTINATSDILISDINDDVNDDSDDSDDSDDDDDVNDDDDDDIYYTIILDSCSSFFIKLIP